MRDRIIMLQESAEELGFGTIQQALDAGYHEVQDLVNNTFKLERVEDLTNKAYEDLDKTEKMNEEAKQIEMVHDILSNAKEMIAMVYKPNGNVYRNPIKDITDEKIRDYYYEINHMCCELLDRNKMIWQKEDNEDKG